jgi:hypothetical protein
MDGPAFYDELRQIDPSQSDRMIFVTGGIFTARARHFLATIPNPRLGKPFDVDALLALVRQKISE